jgi:aspartyl-tRNA(Asn)/glutamyl-tRNA(Gln) amidotransferase subunit C
MKITLDEIKKTAKLSKFDITEDEAKIYAEQLSKVLDWVEQLRDVDTSSVEDISACAAPLRGDEPAPGRSAGDIAAAFNDKSANLLKVKKVL